MNHHKVKHIDKLEARDPHKIDITFDEVNSLIEI